MLSMKKDEFPDGLFLFSALIAWLLCAAILLVLAALIANAAKMGEQGIAYLSSGVSFLCAAAAGKAAAESKKSNSLAIAVITATALVIFLLTAVAILAITLVFWIVCRIQIKSKQDKIDEASEAIPKEVCFKAMKNRNGRKTFKAFFKYRPDYDLFEEDQRSQKINKTQNKAI